MMIRRMPALSFLLPVVYTAFAQTEPVFDPPPRLATTSKEWEALKASPEFPQKQAAAIAAAEKLLADPPVVPEGFGSWVFYYANPKTGQRLEAISPVQHKDPKTGEIFDDEQTIAAWRGIQHGMVDKAALKLAWAYAYSGESRYAEEVRRILSKLSDDYAGYPKRRDRWGRSGWFAPLGGRRYVQSLDEAVGIIRLAKAYDLTRTADVYSGEDRKKVEEKLFRPTAESLMWFNQGINNHQTWYNAGLMCVASILADAELVRSVLSMRGGFYDQMNRSVKGDGLWYEGSMAYHLYSLRAMMEIVDAARRMGIPLQDAPRFKKLFTAPLRAVYPNGQFPAINDSDPLRLESFDPAWRWAWELYGDPIFARALARTDEKKLHELLGPDVQVEWPLVQKSEVLSESGLAVLRSGKGEEGVCVFVDFGPHGGGHGHLDKLNLLLFAKSREWLLDPGRLTYSHKEYHTWVKATAAHNTVAINETNQRATTGRLLYFREDPTSVSAGVECDSAYPKTLLRRHVLLTRTFLVDVFEVNTRDKSRIDLFAHAAADSLTPTASGESTSVPVTPGTRDGYQHLTEGRLWSIQGDSTWDFQWKDRILRVRLLSVPGEELITCEGIGYSIREKTPTLIRRRNAAKTRFVSIYDLSPQSDRVRDVSQTEEILSVETDEATFRWTITPDGLIPL